MTDPAAALAIRRAVNGARTKPRRSAAGVGALLTGLIFGAVLAPHTGWACAACYGRSDSPLAAGMNWGIMSLLGCIVLVLGGVAGFFIFMARRSAALARAGAEVALESEPARAAEDDSESGLSEPVPAGFLEGRPTLAGAQGRRCRSGWQSRRKRSPALAEAGFSRTS